MLRFMNVFQDFLSRTIGPGISEVMGALRESGSATAQGRITARGATYPPELHVFLVVVLPLMCDNDPYNVALL